MRIIFDQSDGLPIKYELLRVHDFFRGKDDGEKIDAVVRNVNSFTESSSAVMLDSAFELSGEIRFKYKLKFEEKNVGSLLATHGLCVQILLGIITQLKNLFIF